VFVAFSLVALVDKEMKNVQNLSKFLFHFCINCKIDACRSNNTDMYEGRIFEFFRVLSGRFWSSGLWHHMIS
jgi:hypothetical protein